MGPRQKQIYAIEWLRISPFRIEKRWKEPHMMVCLPCSRPNSLSPLWKTKLALVWVFGDPVWPSESCLQQSLGLSLAPSEEEAGERLLGVNRISSQNGRKPFSGSLKLEINLTLVMFPILVPIHALSNYAEMLNAKTSLQKKSKYSPLFKSIC